MSESVDTATAVQVAALPLRWDEEGRLRVLMVTSRDSGRWVMPKGWTMDGKEAWRAAEIEAMEEAGVSGRIANVPIGEYDYRKVLPDGTAIACRVKLFPLIVRNVKRQWKERRERKRRWFSVKGAARAVNEPGLVEILSQLREQPKSHPAIAPLRRAS